MNDLSKKSADGGKAQIEGDHLTVRTRSKSDAPTGGGITYSKRGQKDQGE
jgi:hypothetical protein